MNSTVSEITGAPPGEAYLDRFLESKGGFRQYLQKPWRALALELVGKAIGRTL